MHMKNLVDDLFCPIPSKLTLKVVAFKVNLSLSAFLSIPLSLICLHKYFMFKTKNENGSTGKESEMNRQNMRHLLVGCGNDDFDKDFHQ